MDKKIILPSLVAMMVAGTANAGFHSDKTYYSLNSENQNQNNLISPYIIDGTDTTVEEFPYYARLVTTDFANRYADFCGASILSDKYILTAAHCVDDLTDNDLPTIAIIVNNGKAGNGEVAIEELLPVKKFTMHSDYNENTYANDIAVIELETPLASGTYTAIDIPDSATIKEYNSKEIFTAAGLGNTNVTRPNNPICQDEDAVRDQDWFNTCMADSDLPADSLLKADLKNIGDTECLVQVPNYYGGDFSADKQTCALPIQDNGNITAVCNGDSGGPLTYLNADSKYKQFALVSYGSSLGCDEPDAPQVFTEIAGYKTWLANFIKIEGVEPDEPVTDPSFGDDGNFTSGNGDDGGSTGFLTLLGLFGFVSLRKRKK